MIVLKNVGKYYGKNEYKQDVLKDISMEIKDGEMVSIMGPSGSGKSTLLNILGLLDDKFSGEYVIDGVECQSLSEKKRAYLRNEKIGFVFQSFHLMKDLTAIENVRMGLILANERKGLKEKMKKREMKRKAEEMLDLLGLGEHKNKKAFMLSGGQQQRVAIARALINDPKIILADEPTGALDQKTGKEIMEIFKKLNEQGRTILIVTHDEKIANYCNVNRTMIDGKLK